MCSDTFKNVIYELCVYKSFKNRYIVYLRIRRIPTNNIENYHCKIAILETT